MSKKQPLTKVFAKARLDNVTSAMCKHQQRFGLDIKLSALVLNFNNIFFNWAFVPSWTINEFPAFANTRTLAVIVTDDCTKIK